MDPHIKDLFDKSDPFPMGDLSFDPDYDRCSMIVMRLEDMMAECFGGEVAQLMEEYLSARYDEEQFHCLHAFHQGYLAGQAEPRRRKRS